MTNSPASLDLPKDYIKVGNLIWYKGTTSIIGWDCPAQIYKVDEENRVFFVCSWDDFREQSQPYSFEVTEGSPDSRKSMRVTTLDEAMDFLRHGLVATRAMKSTFTDFPDFPYGVEFGIQVHGDWEPRLTPVTLNGERRKFLELWAKQRGIEILVHSRMALFKRDEDAVLCRISLGQ